MEDMFAGLESLGFDNLDGLKLFDDGNEDSDKVTDEQVSAKKEDRDIEIEVLFDKGMECPCCYKEFKVKTVRTGKLKACEPDTDLRPRFEKVDPLKYDAIVCPHCGYAGLSKTFPVITDGIRKLVREQVSATFKGIDTELSKYSYEEAILRYKLVLLNSVVRKSKNGERAYICMKIAWLYRGMAEEMVENNPEADISSIRKEELTNLKFAYDGFYSALMKDGVSSIYEMDQVTIMYLLADLARRLNQKEVAKQWLSRVLSVRGLNRRMKDKAFDLKELLTS